VSASETLFQAIAASGGDVIDVPVVLEASVPLELSGEVVRGRICTFVDAAGREWALRPDLTLPVAQAEIAARQAGATGESRRRYRGPVFRLPAAAGEPVEYEQIGIERFGADSGVAADVWLFDSLAAACASVGVETGRATFGDLSVFPAFVDALELPEDVAAGLKRAFRQEGGVRAYLGGRSEDQSSLSQRLRGMDRDDVAAFVDDIYALTGLNPIGERSVDEIVDRMHARAQASAGKSVSTEIDQLLTQLLSLETAYAEAASELRRIAGAANISGLNGTLDRFEQRAEQLATSAHSGLLSTARFATRFGRRFTYYDGFVFEIAAGERAVDLKRPIAVGGRYDSLLANLSGGAVDATAIGGIVIPHRLAHSEGAVS
jgi:ATP phosphoribosyltransferase regulatory subunit